MIYINDLMIYIIIKNLHNIYIYTYVYIHIYIQIVSQSDQPANSRLLRLFKRKILIPKY